MSTQAAQLSAETAAAAMAAKINAQVAYLKSEIEGRTSARVTVGEASRDGGRHVKISDQGSGYYETYGVTKYGITPSEIRFGHGPAFDKMYRVIRATINKARKIK